MAVLNGIGSKKEEISLTLPGGAHTHLEKAGVLVTLGSCDDVIVEVSHLPTEIFVFSQTIPVADQEIRPASWHLLKTSIKSVKSLWSKEMLYFIIVLYLVNN